MDKYEKKSETQRNQVRKYIWKCIVIWNYNVSNNYEKSKK